MKTRITLMLAALGLLSIQASSQLTFGPKAGMTHSTLLYTFESEDADPGPDWTNPSGIGFHVGAFANYELGDVVSIQPEVLFNKRNTDQRLTESILGETWEFKASQSTNYLDIPILVMVKPVDQISIYAGPQISLLMGNKMTLETTVGDQTETETVTGEDATKDLSGSDIGVTGGVQINIGESLNAGIRYTKGFTPLNAVEQDFYKANWSVIQVALGFTLGS